MRAQVLRNTSSLLDVVFSAGIADGSVTAVAKNSAGATIASGTAGPDPLVPGRYTFALTPQSALEWIDVTWSGTWGGNAQSVVTYAEVVGSYLFSLAEARAFAGGTMADTTAYPDSALRGARSRISDLFRDEAGVAFNRRFEREILTGLGLRALRLKYEHDVTLLSVSVGGVPMSATDVGALWIGPGRSLGRVGGWSYGNRNINVAYEHGYTTPPGDVTRAALEQLHDDLVTSGTSGIDSRATSIITQDGTVRLSTASGSIRLPSVAATVRGHGAPLVF